MKCSTMKTSVYAVLAATVAAVALLASPSHSQSPNCLGCLCEASTKCDAKIGCSSHAGYFCGPFLITWSFWKDAGQPLLVAGDNPDRKGAFEDCANDIYCAADAVALYLKKFEQDCNGDGQITCTDYALIHKVGGYGCRVPVPNNPFFAAFAKCLAVIKEV